MKDKKENLGPIFIAVAIGALLVASPFFLFFRADAASCTVTYSSSNEPPQQLIISASGNYCFEARTYNTQITITASNVNLMANGKVIIEPTTVAINTADCDTSQLTAAIILVGGCTGPSLTGDMIQNLVVNGLPASAFFTSCANDYMGVLYQDASGAISGSTVTDIYLPTGLGGCQDGQGVFVQTTSGYASSVSISNSEVSNYDKNGITCNDMSTQCSISNDVVYPYAAYQSQIASNGVQIGFGATGSISNNLISGNDFCGQLGLSVCLNAPYSTTAAGILTYSSDGVSISNNMLVSNDVGVAGVSDTGAIAIGNNQAQGGSYGGFVLYGERGVSVSNNKATNNGIDGFEFDSTVNSQLSNNQATGNGAQATIGLPSTPYPGTGFYLDLASTGNVLSNNHADKNTGDGFTDASPGLTNSYSNNHCSGNSVSGSSPLGLCK